MKPTANPDEVPLDQLMEGKNLPPLMETYPLAHIPEATVRLKNVAAAFGVETLGEFLRLGRYHRAHKPNYGRKSEADLERIVIQFYRKNHALPPGEMKNTPTPCAVPLDLLMEGKNLPPLMATYPLAHIPEMTVRLKNVAATLNAKTLGEFLRLGRCLRFQSPNYGRKSEADLERIVIGFCRKNPAQPPGEMNNVALARLSFECLNAHPNGECDELKSLAEIIDLPLLQRISPREKLILDQRLLVPGVRQTTLDDMGKSAGVTRERIRQLEVGILGRLRDSRHGLRIGQLLHDSEAGIFERLAAGELGLTETRLALAEREFGGAEMLAIHVLGLSLRQWLDQTFIRETCGWFGGSEEEWSTIKRRLQAWRSEQLPLPEAVVAGSSNVTVREARAYFQLTGRATVFEGYLLGQDSAMFRRAARLHAYLAAEGQAGGEPTRVAEACRQALGRAGTKDHARNGYQAILHTPTLFLSSPSAVVPLGPGAPWRHARPEAEMMNETHEASATERLIAQIVRQNGPITSSALVDVCREDKRIGLAASSVAVLMSKSLEFERLAPGLYDVCELYTSTDRIERARQSLMNEREVRRYSIARYSGEDLPGLFPLWDLEQERRWAVWGRQALSSELWSSLMWVASPELWPNENGERPAEWMGWKERARWCLKVPWQDDLPENLPALRDVLLVTRCAQLVGHMTWIRANQILAASFVQERAGLISVVLGVILGLLEPSAKTRWGRQTPHPDYDREWIEFENLLLIEPTAGWNHPTLVTRFNRATLRAAAGELGWVTVNEISLLRRLMTADLISIRDEVEDGLPSSIAADDDIKI